MVVIGTPPLYRGNGNGQRIVRLDCFREIMGGNFFGIEEAVACFGIHPSKEDCRLFARGIFVDESFEDVLQKHKDTHILIMFLPQSICAMKKRYGELFYVVRSRYDTEPFAAEEGEARLCLMGKNLAEDSMRKKWSYQQALFGHVPSVREMVYTIIGRYVMAGEHLFEKANVRCSDADSNKYRMHVSFDSYGIDIASYWDGYCSPNLGVPDFKVLL